jgi:hypothetical protein
MKVKQRQPALAVITGTIDDMRSQRISTGYNRLFTIRWTELFNKDLQHHDLPVAAYNEMAREVKGDDYQDGDKVTILAKIKTHNELYLELLDIKRGGND